MTEIWFIRHGETDWNVARRLQGWQDIPLNQSGRNQAGLLAQRMRQLEDTRFAALYSSDLQRALHTAEPVGEVLGLRVRTEPGLRERGFGVLEGLDYDSLDTKAPEAAAAWKSRDPLRALEGGETLGQFQARIVATVEDIAARHEGERVLAFTHGGVLDIIWRQASGVPLNGPRDAALLNIIWRQASGVPLNGPRDAALLNVSINKVSVAPRQWRLLDWGDVSHVADEVGDDVTP